MKSELVQYSQLIDSIKGRIRQAQARAILSVNSEMILMCWDVGRLIAERQKLAGWGASVIPRLSADLRNELPEVKGFSERNIGYMIKFAREYGNPSILQQPVAKLDAKNLNEYLPQLVANIPWGHNILLMEKVKDLQTRFWYIQQVVENGWSRDALASMIKNRAHERQGKTTSNFPAHLPTAQSDLVQQALKDPYIFDFLTLAEPYRERELETGLIAHLEKFLLELGNGFAFVGRQYHLDIGDQDFYLDLLFYHLKLRCFVVIDLKKGAFKPEYAGKMNFYCNIVDDHLRYSADQPTIGLILCQDKNHVVAEYALRGVDKPIGVSEYELTRALPEDLKSSLPSIEEIEAEMGGKDEL